MIYNLEKIRKKPESEGYDFYDVVFDKDSFESLFLQLYVKHYNFKNALSNYLTQVYEPVKNFDQNLHFDRDIVINGPLVILT